MNYLTLRFSVVEYVEREEIVMNVEKNLITLDSITKESWSPFGWLPVDDTDPEDGTHRLEFTWSDPHVNIIGHFRSEVPQVGEPESSNVGSGSGRTIFRCEMLYRHDTHTQTIMSIDVPAVIAVAPADVDFESDEDQTTIKAFRIDPLVPIVLHRGTWHWGPFPISADEVRLFNVQGLRYIEDNTRMDLKSKGLSVDIDVSA